MDYILSLNKINRSDSDVVGFKAVDLAELYNKKTSIPISFVIRNSLLSDFIERNNLRQHIDNTLKKINYSDKESLISAAKKIRELIVDCDFSEDMKNELMEAYETLAIDMDHINIAKLVTTIEKPFLTLVGSFNYLDDFEDNESVLQNVRGKNWLLSAIKECWASLYTPRAILYRKENDIDTKETMGVIVQRMTDAQVSVQAYTQEDTVIVKTFLGFQDYREEIGKDVAVFSKKNIGLMDTKVNFQEFRITRDVQSESLTKKPLKTEGEKQKLNDKDAEELARIAKKIEIIIEKPVKVFMSMLKGKVYVMFVNRAIEPAEKKEETRKEEIKPMEKQEEKPEVEDEITDEVPLPDEDQKEDEEEVIEETNFEDDIAFLEEIEKYEKQAEKEEEEKTEEKKAKTTPIKEEPEETEEIIDVEEKEESSDEFIFSEFEERKEEEKKEEVKEEKEEDTVDKALEHIKYIVELSDKAVYSALRKKHRTVLGSEPESFEDAIKNLKHSVRIPFIEEIKKVHKLKEKIDNKEEIEIEEAMIALRTAKNFLTIFS